MTDALDRGSLQALIARSKSYYAAVVTTHGEGPWWLIAVIANVIFLLAALIGAVMR